MPPVVIYKGVKKYAEHRKESNEAARDAEKNTGRIKNAQVRYREHSHNRLTSTQLQKDKPRNNHNSLNTNGVTAGRQDTKNARFSSVRSEALNQMYAEYGEAPEEGEYELVVKNRPEHSPFPIFIVSLALIKDFLDVVATISVVGIFLIMPASFLISIILFIWVLGKMSGGWWKKRMIKWLWTRYVIVVLIELVPLMQIIPATTIFVLMAHYREKKIVQMFDSFLEKLHGSKIKL